MVIDRLQKMSFYVESVMNSARLEPKNFNLIRATQIYFEIYNFIQK